MQGNIGIRTYVDSVAVESVEFFRHFAFWRHKPRFSTFLIYLHLTTAFVRRIFSANSKSGMFGYRKVTRNPPIPLLHPNMIICTRIYVYTRMHIYNTQVGDPLEVMMHSQGKDDTTLRCEAYIEERGWGGGAWGEVVGMPMILQNVCVCVLRVRVCGLHVFACMCVYVCCSSPNVHVNTHTHTHNLVHTCTHTHKHVQHTHAQARAHSHVHACTRTRTHTHARARTHTNIQIHTKTHT